MIADLAAIDGGVKAQSESVFGNTFREAQLYNLQMQKVRTFELHRRGENLLSQPLGSYRSLVRTTCHTRESGDMTAIRWLSI